MDIRTLTTVDETMATPDGIDTLRRREIEARKVFAVVERQFGLVEYAAVQARGTPGYNAACARLDDMRRVIGPAQDVYEAAFGLWYATKEFYAAQQIRAGRFVI